MGTRDYFNNDDPGGGDLSELTRYEDSLLGDSEDAVRVHRGDPEDWTDADEDALEEFEENRRRRIAERNEY